MPADNSFGACATVEDIEYRSFDIGFDFEKSSKTRVVSGVVPDSNAHKAGPAAVQAEAGSFSGGASAMPLAAWGIIGASEATLRSMAAGTK